MGVPGRGRCVVTPPKAVSSKSAGGKTPRSQSSSPTVARHKFRTIFVLDACVMSVDVAVLASVAGFVAWASAACERGQLPVARNASSALAVSPGFHPPCGAPCARSSLNRLHALVPHHAVGPLARAARRMCVGGAAVRAARQSCSSCRRAIARRAFEWQPWAAWLPSPWDHSKRVSCAGVPRLVSSCAEGTSSATLRERSPPRRASRISPSNVTLYWWPPIGLL